MSHKDPITKRITELEEIKNASGLDIDDLFELVDLNGDPDGDPKSYSTSFKVLYDLLLDYDSKVIRNALDRYVRVDDDYPDNDGPTFNSLELAIDYARGIINTSGGKVLINVFFDSNGDPLSTDLTDYSWYSSDPADSDIEIFSPISNTNESAYLKTLLIDGVYDDSEAPFDLDDSELSIRLYF